MENINPALKLALAAVKKAGVKTLEYYGQELEVVDKGANSPLTQADLASDKILRTALGRTGWGILSEEGVDSWERLAKDLVWVIDPLDGTKDFINQTGEFTIMAGLVEKQARGAYRPVLGLVYQPVSQTMYYAVKGKGAYRISAEGPARRIFVSPELEPDKLKMFTSRNHSTELESRLARNLGVTKIIPLGSSLKACRVAEGEGHININSSPKTWEWDVCASDIIVSEAGGKLTDIFGHIITYNKKDARNLNGYLVTNGILHQKVLDCVKQ